MASPSLSTGTGSSRAEYFDSLPTHLRLKSPSGFDTWKTLVYERLHERGLSHVSLVWKRPSEIEKRATSDELGRVVSMLKYSVVARVRNKVLGGPDVTRDKPWEVWADILSWVREGAESDAKGDFPRRPQPARPPVKQPVKQPIRQPELPRSEPRVACSYDKLSLLLRSITTICLSDFDNLSDYFAGFKIVRRKLIDMDCSLTEMQYITLLIMGIKDAQEHKAWTRRAKEAMETYPNISLNWVQQISGAKLCAQDKANSRDLIREGNGHDLKRTPNAGVDSHPHEFHVMGKSMDKKLEKESQEELERAAQPSIAKKADDYEPKVGISMGLKGAHTEPSSVPTSDPHEHSKESHPETKEKTANKIFTSTTREQIVLSSPVGPNRTMTPPGQSPIISKIASSPVKEVAFDISDHQKPTSGARIASQNTSSTRLKPDETIKPILKKLASVSPSRNSQSLEDWPHANRPLLGQERQMVGRDDTKASQSPRMQIQNHVVHNDPHSPKPHLSLVTGSPTLSNTLYKPQHDSISLGKKKCVSFSPAIESTPVKQTSTGQTTLRAVDFGISQDTARKASLIVSEPQRQLLVAVNDKASVQVRGGPGAATSPFAEKADANNLAKDLPGPATQRIVQHEVPDNASTSTSRKRGLSEEIDEKHPTAGPQLKKRVSAMQLMQKLMSKR